MKVVLAKSTGFCHGVERAVTLALEAAEMGPVRADGPLLHNSQALKLLARRGVNFSPARASARAFATDASSPAQAQAASVLIRAHGAAPARRAEWLRAGLRIVDATCVHVARSQRLAGAAEGHVVLAGDAGHAEVIAVAAAAAGGCTVVRNVADIEALAACPPPVLLLAQTTFSANQYREIAAAFARRFPAAEITDTICQATRVRQGEAVRLARSVDVVVVVGDRQSANTRRLADIVREAGRPVFLAETAADLDPAALACYRSAGVTSGASTPGWVTQKVVDRLAGLGRLTAAGWTMLLLRRAGRAGITAALSAAGLVVVLALPALLSGASVANWLTAGLFVFLLYFAGASLRDLRDPASDRLLGRTTIALRLGSGPARRLAAAAFTAATAIPPALSLAGVWTGAAGPALLPLLMLAPAWGREVLELQRVGRLRDATHLRAAIDAIGIVAGAVAAATLVFA